MRVTVTFVTLQWYCHKPIINCILCSRCIVKKLYDDKKKKVYNHFVNILAFSASSSNKETRAFLYISETKLMCPKNSKIRALCSALWRISWLHVLRHVLPIHKWNPNAQQLFFLSLSSSLALHIHFLSLFFFLLISSWSFFPVSLTRQARPLLRLCICGPGATAPLLAELESRAREVVPHYHPVSKTPYLSLRLAQPSFYFPSRPTLYNRVCAKKSSSHSQFAKWDIYCLFVLGRTTLLYTLWWLYTRGSTAAWTLSHYPFFVLFYFRYLWALFLSNYFYILYHTN